MTVKRMRLSKPHARTLESFRHALRLRVSALGGVTRAAKLWKMHHPNIVAVLQGRRTPGERLVAAIGWEKITWYRRKKTGFYVDQLVDDPVDLVGAATPAGDVRGTALETEE